MKFSRLILAMIGALVVSSAMVSSASAWVEDKWARAKPFTVKAGSTTEITWTANLDKRFCTSSGVPTFSADQQGTLGTFAGDVRQMTVRQEGSEGASQCEGTKIQAIHVTYKAGLKPGTERSSFVLSNMGYGTRYIFDITVK